MILLISLLMLGLMLVSNFKLRSSPGLFVTILKIIDLNWSSRQLTMTMASYLIQLFPELVLREPLILLTGFQTEPSLLVASWTSPSNFIGRDSLKCLRIRLVSVFSSFFNFLLFKCLPVSPYQAILSYYITEITQVLNGFIWYIQFSCDINRSSDSEEGFDSCPQWISGRK